MVDFRVPRPGLTLFSGEIERFDVEGTGSGFFVFTCGDPSVLSDRLLIEPFDIALALAGLGSKCPLCTPFVPYCTCESSIPREIEPFSEPVTAERGLLPVVAEEDKVGGLDEDLRVDLAGDAGCSLFGGIGRLTSFSSSLRLKESSDGFGRPSGALVELVGFDPGIEAFEVLAEFWERGPSATDRGREDAFEMLPLGVWRAIDDAVGLEEAGGVAGLGLLSVPTLVRFGGIPFFGETLCRLSRALSCFLGVDLWLGTPAGCFASLVA